MEMYAFPTIRDRRKGTDRRGPDQKDSGKRRSHDHRSSVDLYLCLVCLGGACVGRICRDRANWFGWKSPYNPVVSGIAFPIQKFIVKDRSQTSFSTNNYLGIATRPGASRPAAIRGHQDLRRRPTAIAGCSAANLGLYGDVRTQNSPKSTARATRSCFATGYLANIGALLDTAAGGTASARAFGYTASREYTYAYFNGRI